ncbi:MAG: c-type cytochrome [Deltaproteobacteria bacterium]|nr:c-type cytochrome [Deltaproteobacteria bacterium]
MKMARKRIEDTYTYESSSLTARRCANDRWRFVCMTRYAIAVAFLVLLSRIVASEPANGSFATMPGVAPPRGEPTTTFEKFLPLAETGDPQVQNFIAFMLFHGEGVRRDREQAHEWFHRAAEQGYAAAQRNLALMHSGTIAGVSHDYIDLEEAGFWLGLADGRRPRPKKEVPAWAFRDDRSSPGSAMVLALLEAGERTYLAFCGGCHGFNGIAYYVGSPSFALGERMHKTDGELYDSLINGHVIMPAWGAMLSPEEIAGAILFVRALRATVDNGIGARMRMPPEMYFQFSPLGGWAGRPTDGVSSPLRLGGP